MLPIKTPAPKKYLMPRDADAVGPQNEAEHRLYELIMEGMNSSQSEISSVDALIAKLHARIANQR